MLVAGIEIYSHAVLLLQTDSDYSSTPLKAFQDLLQENNMQCLLFAKHIV